jgi:hypothetical protein
MRLATMRMSLVMGLLLLASSAFAANKGNLQLQNPVSVNGTSIKPGEYKVEWDGTGPNVELSILQGKKVLAKVPAHVVELSSPPDNNAAVTKKGDDGSWSLSEIRFGGKKMALALGESSDGAQASK